MNWFIFAILSGLFFAAARVISRALLKKQGNALAFTTIHDFIAGLVLIPFIFINLKFPEQPVTWLYFFGFTVFALLADWLAFIALKRIDVSLYQIVNQVRHIFILVGGLIIFTEAITLVKVAAIILIIIGVIVALYEKSKFIFNKGIAITMTSTLCAVIAFLFAKAMVADFSETASASFSLLLIGVMLFGLLRFNPKVIQRELQIQKWGLVISGALFGVYQVLLLLALKIGEASKVIPVNQAALIFTVLAGIIFLRERSRLMQKLLGVVIIGAGIIVMYLF